MNQSISMLSKWKIATQKRLFVLVLLSILVFFKVYGQLDLIIQPINEASDKLIQHQSAALNLVKGLAASLKKHDKLVQEVKDLQEQAQGYGVTVKVSSKLNEALASAEAKVVGGLEEILSDISARLKVALSISSQVSDTATVDPRIQDTIALGYKNAAKKVPKNLMSEIRDFQASHLKTTSTKQKKGLFSVDVDLASQNNPSEKLAVQYIKAYTTQYLKDDNPEQQKEYLENILRDVKGALEAGNGIFAENQASESDALSTAFDGFVNRISSIGKNIDQGTEPWTDDDKTVFITDEASTANIKSLITLIQEKLQKSPAHYKAYMSKY